MKTNKKLYSIALPSIAIILFLTLVLSTASAVSGQNTSSVKAYAYITNYADGTVSIIDTDTDTVTSTVKVESRAGIGGKPLGIAVSPDGTKVYVANALEAGIDANSISIIGTDTNSVVASVGVGNYPFGVAVNPSGKEIYVANWGERTVSVIDTDTNEVTASINTGLSPTGIAFAPDGKKAYVTNSGNATVSVISTATKQVTSTLQNVGYTCWGIAVNPAGTKAYMASSFGVSVIDTDTDSIIARVPLGIGPYGVAINPEGTRVYVTNSGDNTTSIIDTATNTIIAVVPVGARPLGVAINPEGTKVYVANVDSNNVSVIDTRTNKVIANVSVGTSPVAFGQFIGTPPVQPEVLKINDFTATITSGKAPLKTEFISDVTGTNITKWRWDFEPSGKDTYSQHAVTAKHTFTKPGVYNITLTVWDVAGRTATLTKPAYIVVCPAASVKMPVADFVASVTCGNAPLKVTFTDMSTGSPGSWKWSFGDGTYSTTRSLVHKYSKAGKYTVSLTVKNAKGSNTKTMSGYITVKK